MKKIDCKKILVLSCAIFSLFSFIIVNNGAHALTAADWKAGNIIDDIVFTDKNSMTVDEIQAFLNRKVPNCDTYGQKTSELGGGTRADYGASHNNPIPYTCLKDYYEVPKTDPSPGFPDNNYGGNQSRLAQLVLPR